MKARFRRRGNLKLNFANGLRVFAIAKQRWIWHRNAPDEEDFFTIYVVAGRGQCPRGVAAAGLDRANPFCGRAKNFRRRQLFRVHE